MSRTRIILIPIALFVLLFAAVVLSAPASAQEGANTEEIEKLLNELESGDFLAQEQAGQALAKIGSPLAIPRLRTIFLESDNPRPAAVAHAGLGNTRAMTILVGALADEELTPRRNAAQVALLEAGEQSVIPLVAGLHAVDPVLRRHAADLLGFIGSPRAVNALSQTARSDEDAAVRASAVWALGEIGEPRAANLLKALVRTDPDRKVQIEALRAVLRLGERF